MKSWALLALVASPTVLAHGIAAGPTQADDAEWLSVALPLALTAVLYAVGAWRLTRRSQGGRRVHHLQFASFGAGWLTLSCALLSPLDTWSARLFSVHMVQHEVLMLIAAPLLVLGRPIPIFLWALSQGARGGLSRAARARAWNRFWSALTHPLMAWSLHAAALWVWHAPQLFEAALANRPLHDLQHISFLASALLFWFALLNARAREQVGAAVLYLFTTTIHTSVLGALITFGSRPWYPAYRYTAPLLGLSTLEDQQLGGLIMWVPGSIVYIGFALVLLARWIGEPQWLSKKPGM